MGVRFKFNLIILLIFTISFLAAGYLVKQVLIENAKHEVAHNAGIMMAAAKSARSYTVDEIRPLLRQLGTAEFLPQTVPAYSATESMKRLRKSFPDYTYKEAALNPTNPEHKAADWEEDIIHYFQTYEDVEEYVGVRDTPTGQYLFLSRPFRITNQNCLACHSDPAIAPPNMLQKYGRNNGFGWKHNEIIGAQIVNVPMTLPLARAEEAFTTFMIILGVIFLVSWALLNLLLYVVIIKRIDHISLSAEKISKGDLSSGEVSVNGKDEIDSLAQSFNLIYRSLRSAVKLLDKTQAGIR